MTRAASAAIAERAAIALAFETMTDAALNLAAQAAVIDHGGTLTQPRGTWGPVETEISLLGISGSGDDIADAARRWTKHCLRSWAAMTEEAAA